MEYQKIINLLDNTPSQPSKFRIKNWAKISDYLRWMYNTNSQIKFKISMLKSTLCDYSDAYILFKATVTGAEANDANKKIIVKYCASFTDCISEINNTQVDNAEEIDVVMSMYNLIEYSDNYLRISGIL